MTVTPALAQCASAAARLTGAAASSRRAVMMAWAASRAVRSAFASRASPTRATPARRPTAQTGDAARTAAARARVCSTPRASRVRSTGAVASRGCAARAGAASPRCLQAATATMPTTRSAALRDSRGVDEGSGVAVPRVGHRRRPCAAICATLGSLASVRVPCMRTAGRGRSCAGRGPRGASGLRVGALCGTVTAAMGPAAVVAAERWISLVTPGWSCTPAMSPARLPRDLPAARVTSGALGVGRCSALPRRRVLRRRTVCPPDGAPGGALPRRHRRAATPSALA